MAMATVVITGGGRDCGNFRLNPEEQERARDWYAPLQIDFEAEQAKPRRFCNFFITWLILVTFIAFCVTIPVLVVPGFEVRQYEPASCSISTMVYKGSKKCGCGKDCSSSFPCFEMSGEMSILSGSNVSMSYYSNYYDMKKGCTFAECNRDVDENTADVLTEVMDFFDKYAPDIDQSDAKFKMITAMATDTEDVSVTVSGIDYSEIETFDCHGNDDKALLELLKSTVFIVCGFIPAMVLVVAVAFFFSIGSPAYRKACCFLAFWPLCYLKDKERAREFTKRGPLQTVFC